MYRSFLAAMSLLTRVPVPGHGPADARTSGRSLLWYPMVGLLMGIVLWGAAAALGDAPVMMSAALVLTLWCVLTGGLHLDGLADSADALVGGHGRPERALEIMKDPASGAMAVTAIALLLMLKFAALHAHLSQGDQSALLLAPVLARAAVIALFLTTPYVRPGGLGELLAAGVPRTPAYLAVIAVAAVAVIAGGAAALIGAALVFILIRGTIMRAFRGTTGDTAGALIEIVEAGVLIAAAI